MAKSPRTGDNRGRRTPERRTAPEAAAPPEQLPAADDRGAAATAAGGDRVATPVPPLQAERPVAGAGLAPAGLGARPRLRVATREQIANRAYEIYKARGGAPGSDIEDWLQAERELRSR